MPGTLTVVVNRVYYAALAGAGTLSAVVTPSMPVQINFSGTGTLGRGLFFGTGTLSAVAYPAGQPLVPYTGAGSMTNAVVPVIPLLASLAGTGALTAGVTSTTFSYNFPFPFG